MNMEAKPVSSNARIAFRCEKCAACCQNLADPFMLDALDAYRLAKHLREHGECIEGTDDVLSRYAEPALVECYPIFRVKTAGKDAACIFLKDGKCSVYGARPQVCRLYPFTVAPGSKGRDFQYLLCTERDHHFGRGSVTVKDWMSENFPKEAREFSRAQNEWFPRIARGIHALGDTGRKRALFRILYYLYYGYDLDKPFLPQYEANMEELEKALSEERSRGN